MSRRDFVLFTSSILNKNFLQRMFRKSFQNGFLTVLFAGGSSPLKIWDRLVTNGHIKRVTDEDVRVLVLEMRGTNVATCFIYTPICPSDVLGIRLPFFVMIIKNLKKYFSFEIMILDDRHMRRRFRVSNYQTTTKVRPFGTTMPIGLSPGWNQIQFNLADFTKRAYGSVYVETQRLQIHANCRIRRIYFCDKLYPEDEIPNEYKLFYPHAKEKPKEDQPRVKVEVPPPSVVGDEEESGSVEEDTLRKPSEIQEEEDEAPQGVADKSEPIQEPEEEAPPEAFAEEEEETGGGEEEIKMEEGMDEAAEESAEEGAEEIEGAEEQQPSEEAPE